MMTGVASGISTRQRSCRRVYPMPTATSFTSASTPRNPARLLRKRISRLYVTRGTATVVSDSPVNGISKAINASAGIVYSTLATTVLGPVIHRCRDA
jgi:hypothetical protein